MQAVAQTTGTRDDNRYRVIISADFPPLDVIPGGAGYGPAEKRSDPDDVQSMVRFLLYTNVLDVEGIIASSGTFANIANKNHILDILDLYDQIDENLMQRDPKYPTADYLRSITWEGNSGNWGKPVNEVLGEGKNSEASEAIIRIVDQSDDRPVWVCVWGGPQEVAQAIWKVQQTRSPAELDRFISKLRIYMIGLGSKTGQDGSGQWMLDNFPNLFVIVSQKTYGGMFAQKSPIGNLEWLNANIREGHGPLGAVYPRSGFNPDSPGMQEGDTPSFMYLVSAASGMNNPEHPDQESWGGQYEQRDPTKNHWYDGPDAESVRKWLPDIQKDFALRSDWMLPHDNYNFRPRVIHTTDLGADPDDQMSMVRHFVVSNWFDTEGLVVNTGCWRKEQRNTEMLDALTDSYAQVVPNLKVHDPSFPTAEYVRSITVMGQTGYGMDDVGDGKDTAGSEMIIASVDKEDPRPLWATCWGGCNTIAQALWKVKNTRSAEELAAFVSKLHIYDILGQDNAGTWIAKTFPEILYIRATKVYSWQHSDEWADTHVQSHGPLGAAYPDPPWAYEGDSPAIFHLIPNGLHDPTVVTQGGWGGRFAAEKKTGIRGMSCMDGEDAVYDPYGMYNEADESINRWKQALQNDFAARMDWSITSNYEDANHHPVANLNGDKTRQVLEHFAESGSSVSLHAAGSSDPDGDEFNYSWWFYDEASSYDGTISIQGSNSESATVSVPANASGRDIHIVLEIQDNGSPSLTAYRRMIINVQ